MTLPARFVLASLLLTVPVLAQQVPVPLGGTIGPVTNGTGNVWTWSIDGIGSGVILPGDTASVTIPEDPALCGQTFKLTCDFPPLAPFTVEIIIVC